MLHIKDAPMWLRYLLDYKKYLQGKPCKYIWNDWDCNFCSISNCQTCIWTDKEGRTGTCGEWAGKNVPHNTVQVENIRDMRREKYPDFVKARLIKLNEQIKQVRAHIGKEKKNAK